MDGFFVLTILFVLFIFLGTILGVIAFFKTRRLERELRKARIEFSHILVRDELRKPEPGSVFTGQDEETAAVIHTAKIDDDVVADKAIANEQTKEQVDESSAKQSADVEQETGQSGISALNTEKPAKPGRDLEETIGSLWAVWVGGLALALGAVFLVKFSIERGLLSPAVRILLGLLFSGALVALGEWSRRRGEEFSFTGFKKANIPAILTAAGTMGAFATIYAAYELYNMLPPLVAFFALGIVAVATTFAALLHGPLLAALGILASFVAPMLVSTTNPSIPGLGTYIVAVSASGFVVGRLRLWKWLAVATAGGLILYGFILHGIGGIDDQGDRLAIATYIIASWCMIAYVFIISLYEKSASQLAKIDKTASALLAVMLALILASTLLYPADFVSAILLLAVVTGPFMLAFFYSASRAGIYAAMAISTIGYLGWSIDLGALPEIAGINDIDTLLTNFQVREKLSMFTFVGVMLAVTGAAIGLWGVTKSTSRAALAIGGAFLPLLLFCAVYIRVEIFSSSWSFSFIALTMFAGFLFISNFIYNRLGDQLEGRDGASAAYAVAAFVALALSISLVLEKAALTIALALMVPAIAFVYNRRPLPALRPLTVFAAALWIGRIIWEPSIIGDDLGTTPIFNWLTYGYGIPTAGFAIATWLLGSSGRDKWLEALEAITLASLVATLGLVGLHAIDPAEVFTPIDTLEEAALIAIISGGVALALLLIDRTKTSFVLNRAVTLLGYLGMVGAAGGLLLIFNPWITSDGFGTGKIFNGLLFAYLFPGMLYLALGWYARAKRHKFYVNTAFVIGALLIATWINLSIRHAFHPFGLHRGPTYDSELYSYSFVWLLIGIGILAAGILTRTKRLRMVSVGILVLVVAKVFLFDMAGLEGIFRALSFIGLGATLIGIGLVYQRVLSKPDFHDEMPDRVPDEDA